MFATEHGEMALRCLDRKLASGIVRTVKERGWNMAGVPRGLVSAAALLFMAAAAHAERKVYKCTDAGGVVIFSEQTCGKDAKEMNVDPGRVEAASAAAAASPDSASPRSVPAKKRAPDAVRDISDSADDASCRHEAERLAAVRNDGHLDDLVRRRDNMASEVAANDNSAGSVWERRQISIMEVAIEQERSRISLQELQAQAVSRAALAKCDAARAAREKSRTQ